LGFESDAVSFVRIAKEKSTLLIKFQVTNATKLNKQSTNTRL